MKLSGLLAVAGALLAMPSLALAQSASIPPELMGRLNALGRLAGDAPFCEALGYAPADPDGSVFSAAVGRWAGRVGVAPHDAEAVIAAAKAREAAEMQPERDRVMANLKDPSGDKALRAFADDLAVRCDKAANDTVATVLMKPPVGRVSTVSRRFVDNQLAAYGRAGWQSEYVLAAGALAETAGACEARLPRPQTRAYLAEIRNPLHYAPDIGDTIIAWLDQQVAKGKDSARKAAPSAAQCQQMATKHKKALDKAPVD